MNEHPSSLLPERAVEVNKQALYRKFRIWHVCEWLAHKKLKLAPGVGVEPVHDSETELDIPETPDGSIYSSSSSDEEHFSPSIF